MRRLVLMCLAGLLMTAAVAAASPLIGRPAATSWFSAARHAPTKSARRRVTHKKSRPGPTHTVRSTLASAATAAMLFGDQTVEAGRAEAVAGVPEAFPFTSSSAGSATSIAVYVGARNRARTLLAGLYANENGDPGALIASGSLTSPKAGGWNSVPIHSATVTPGTYWVAVLGEGGAIHFRDRSDGVCDSQRAGTGSLPALPSSWEDGATGTACPISAYVEGTLSPDSSGGGGSGTTTTTTTTTTATTPTTTTDALTLPPLNTAAPTVTGSPVAGDTLTATNGSWDDSPTSYADQWQDCTAGSLGLPCTDISGATASSYTLTRSDVGDAVRVVVTASNSAGATSAPSSQTGVVTLPPPPANDSLPVVTGSPVEGQTLSSTAGSWSNTPTGYAYAWEDCNGSGSSCTAISNATSSSYTLTSDDVGDTIRSVVTASNDGGSTAASSAQTALVTIPAPKNTALPAIGGETVQGQTLTTTNGSWSGSPRGYTYAWEDCNGSGSSCTAISNATSSSYTLTGNDVGDTIRSIVTASNSGGPASATSNASSTVTSNTPPTNTALPAIGGETVQGQTLTTTNGSWSGSPTGYTYAWEDCNGSGSSCTAISNATSSSYTLTGNDVGDTIRSIVTASNSGGPASATSNASSTVTSNTPPTNTALPAIGGETVQGQTLTTTNGSWSGSPTGYTYAWEDCNGSGSSCTAISNATSSSYTLTGNDVGDAIRSIVTASNSGGPASATSNASSIVTSSGGGSGGSGGSGGLPSGVTLQAVDGGSCTTSTGPCYDNYYCSHVLTNACNAGGTYPAPSWDSPSFFPIAQDYYYCSQPIASYLTEGLNVLSRVNSDCSSSTLGTPIKNNHLWLIAGSDQYTDSPDCQSSGFGPETVGWHMDEPVTWHQSTASDCAAMAQPNPSITAAVQAFSDFSSGGVTGRFLQPVFTANEFPSAPVSANKIATGANGIPSSCGSVANSVVAQQSVMSCTSGLSSGRHMDIATLDSYWFAGSDGASHYTMYCQYLYGVTCNNDQVGRASNYGDTIDVMRSWTPAPHVPSAAYIETGNGLVSGTSRDITPMEFNWADWDELIHGARMLLYFTDSSNATDAGFPTTSVGGTTMAAQGTATDDLVESLAPIINSPFALNYATNSAGGYAFPTEHLELDNGVDESVHYYTGNTFTNSAGTFGPGFYIIVTPRGSESQTMPETVTFTLPSGDTTPAGGVQDVCACSPTQSTGNVSYSSSTHQFTETFNSIGDVHIIGPFEGAAPASQPIGDPTGKTWTSAFDDEFNGTTIDSSRWAALNWSLNNETGKAADCTESGGSAVLALPGNGTGCDLSSAPGYGAGANGWTLNVGDYVEARVWFPGPGSSPTSTIDNWPAIWALGVNPGGSGEPAGEIDFAEALGKLEVNYHSNTANDSVATPPGNWGNSWHVYGVYRGPTEDQVFWDGNLVATVTTADNGGPETVILTSGGANSCCGAPSVTGAAGNVFVDWVRGWQ